MTRQDSESQHRQIIFLYVLNQNLSKIYQEDNFEDGFDAKDVQKNKTIPVHLIYTYQ